MRAMTRGRLRPARRAASPRKVAVRPASPRAGNRYDRNRPARRPRTARPESVVSSGPYAHVPLEFELIRAVVLTALAAFAILVALPALINLAARAGP
jgi:hypothetical protein